MKKVLLVVLLAAFGFGSANKANAQAFEQGKSYIQVGYGFGNFIQAVFSTYESYDAYKFSTMGPMFGKYEYAISDKVGIGLNVAYASANVDYRTSYFDQNFDLTDLDATIKWSTISVLGRLNLHFGDHDRIDPYWGVGIGYRTASWKWEYSDPNYTGNESFDSVMPFGFETTFGTRFLFTDNIGAYAEIGLAKAVFQAGLVIKL